MPASPSSSTRGCLDRIMESISSVASFSSSSSAKLLRVFNVPKHSGSPRHPRSLVISNVKTQSNPPVTTKTAEDKREIQSYEFKSPKKPLNVQSFATSSSTLRSPRPLSAILCNVVDDFINNFVDRPLRTSVHPRHVLAGNFAPVGETAPTECTKVKGTLPACLEGVYLRNGPNPRYVPRGGLHLFDGDGMLHALRIKDGRATYCSRFVVTYKYALEDAAGGSVVPKVFSGFYSVAGLARGALLVARVALGLFNPLHGFGLANTSLLFFDNKLMALWESDLPYVVGVTADGDVETKGRYDFEGRISSAMTAHPKIDRETGDLFAFRYGASPPFLKYFRVTASGEKEPDVGIRSMPRPSFVHDFAVTKRYAVFPDTQIVMNPLDMIFGEGSLIGAATAKVPRIGVLPRYATDDSAMRWFDVPGFNLFHTLNAWDEGDEVVVVATNSTPIEHVLHQMERNHSTAEMVRVNLKIGRVSRRPLSSLCLEMGVVNSRFVARKNRYAYMSVCAPPPKISGIVKLDFERAGAEECVVASREYGKGCFGSEPFFVARTADMKADEDDGYVVTYVHNEGTGVSEFVVMDARSLEVVASVELPGRVPYGFHGLFVSENDLAAAS